ncbi:MAG: hemerythrin domain-containing protein [Dehalococcoidales bacterium]|nr:hemerythrin domain-containing protein [Dehalococcoidales bacterium]
MKPTEQLTEEHNAIKEMLKIMDKVSQRLEVNKKVDSGHLDSIADFISVFADKCHHGKEEGALFPAMIEAGIPKDGSPIGVMLAEHEQGRKYVKEMINGIDSYKKGEKSAASKIASNAKGYTALLRQHIYKEDNILYPMGVKQLSNDIQDKLLEEFEKIEEEKIGAGKHEELHKTLHRLKEFYLEHGKS